MEYLAAEPATSIVPSASSAAFQLATAASPPGDAAAALQLFQTLCAGGGAAAAVSLAAAAAWPVAPNITAASGGSAAAASAAMGMMRCVALEHPLRAFRPHTGDEAPSVGVSVGGAANSDMFGDAAHGGLAFQPRCVVCDL